MEFDVIAREYSGMLYRHIHRMVGNREDAQDVLQEVLLLIYRKLDTFKGEASLKTWLFRVASNRTIDFLRRRSRQPETEPAEGYTSSSDPYQHTLHLDRRDQLARTLAALPEEQREVVVLKEIDGFTFREIGEMLGIPENTAKTRLYTALRKMKTHLTRCDSASTGHSEGGGPNELPDTP